jgi:hypothetical protein
MMALPPRVSLALNPGYSATVRLQWVLARAEEAIDVPDYYRG